jgi:(1->4)-alpha-D-glucan 1-alpha-D-glucosylmutase
MQADFQAAISTINGTVGDPRSFDALEALASAQHYRLAHWRVAAHEINYRRFFDINDLAAIRVERFGPTGD